jgi:hypothetical protein
MFLMGTRVLVAGAAALLIVASAASATPRAPAKTYVYDVQVTGSVLTRENHQGTPNGNGTVELRLTYEMLFRRVAVRVNPLTATVRLVATAKRAGVASGKFSFDSRVQKNVCAGGFDFRGLGATLALNAHGPQIAPPRFILNMSIADAALDALLVRIEKAEGSCPTTRPGKPQAPAGPVPAGAGMRVVIGSFPGAIFTRAAWERRSVPLAQLLAGRPFRLDTGVRRQSVADVCEPGTCGQQLSGRVQVSFKRVP